MRKDAVKGDYLRTVGIRLLRIPNAMVLEHPDEFVRKVVGAMGAVGEKATFLLAGKSAVPRPMAPLPSLTVYLTKPRCMGIVDKLACVREGNDVAHAEPATIRVGRKIKMAIPLKRRPRLPPGGSNPTRCHCQGLA